jgi:methylmalonyl-CoA carboxyltransferase large subunit
MKPETVNSDRLAEAVEALRQEVARLGQRVAALEAATARSQESGIRSQGTGPETPDKARDEGVSEEILLVISAAVAAFLGKKPPIRQIRLLGTTAWAQQGRVTIQASHALSPRHTRSPH